MSDGYAQANGLNIQPVYQLLVHIRLKHCCVQWQWWNIPYRIYGVDKTGPLTIPNTGGWQTWQSTTKTVTLTRSTGYEDRHGY